MAKDERTNRTFRYLTKQSELVHTETCLPKNAPDRWKNPTTLWNEVEQLGFLNDDDLKKELKNQMRKRNCETISDYIRALIKEDLEK